MKDERRTASWLPLTSRAAAALRGLGLELSDPRGQALLGLPCAAGSVPRARHLVLPGMGDWVWWAGDGAQLTRYAAERGWRLERRWLSEWGPARGRTVPGVMGVVNVTPDSFSDGGRFLAPEAAVQAVRRHLREGASWADLGGESTRPGFQEVGSREEWERLRPVLDDLTGEELAQISVDTRKPEVAAQALSRGVAIINDISGGGDAMRAVMAASDAGYVLMFNQAVAWKSGALDLAAMLAFLADGLARWVDRGLDASRVAIDPGLGFGYGVEDNLTVLAHLEVFRVFRRPLLVGASRKRFIGQVTGRPVGERDAGSKAAAAIACLHGADIIRAHEVAGTLDAVRMAGAVAAHE
jgi:dihydropteroate synthase